MLLDIGREPAMLFAYIASNNEIQFLRQKTASEDINMGLTFMSIGDSNNGDGALAPLSTYSMEHNLAHDALADLYCVVFAADM